MSKWLSAEARKYGKRLQHSAMKCVWPHISDISLEETIRREEKKALSLND